MLFAVQNSLFDKNIMTELSSEGLKQLNMVIYAGQNLNLLQTSIKTIEMITKRSQSSTESQDSIEEISSKSQDPTKVNKSHIIELEKTGQLLKRIKRELSTQTLQKTQDPNSNKFNDKLSTAYSYSHNNFLQINWELNQKNQMEDAVMDEYQRWILRYKTELNDLREQKKEIKQTLEKQRRFFMQEMYSKESVLDQNEFQIERLKGQIEKHLNLEFQLQQKIRLLELQVSEYKYQLQGQFGSSREISDSMEPINEENQDYCINSVNSSPKNQPQSNRMFMSLDFNYGNNTSEMDDDPLEVMRLAHEREIIKYEKEIKILRDFYQNRIRALRKSYTPIAGKPRNSIYVMDEYACPDRISCDSQIRPQNLRNILREQMNQLKSDGNIDNSESFVTVKHFIYPQNERQNLNGSDIFIRQPDNQQKEQNQQEVKQPIKRKQFSEFLPSKQFIKGFGFGSIACGIAALIVYPCSLKN